MNKIINYNGAKYIYIDSGTDKIVEKNWLFHYEEGIDEVRKEWIGKKPSECSGYEIAFLKPYNWYKLRDTARISKVLAALVLYWVRNPDLRLSQIVCNMANIDKTYRSCDPYNYEDDALLKMLEQENDKIQG